VRYIVGSDEKDEQEDVESIKNDLNITVRFADERLGVFARGQSL
jgi:hypothetical protein